jgi:putative transposase
MADLPKRKNAPRLPGYDYCGPNIYFVTCTTHLRKPIFLNKRTVDTVIPVINDVSERMGFDILVFCFMPDHLHLLLGGQQNSDLRGHVKAFKQASAYSFKREFNETLWQRSYYEHVLRREETVEDIARYILNNPVRAGLVEDFRQYPYSGSSLFDIQEL